MDELDGLVVSWRTRFDEIIKREKENVEKSIKQTLESLRPVMAEAEKMAQVTVKQTPDGKVEVETHGKAVVEDPKLKEQLLKYLSEKQK